MPKDDSLQWAGSIIPDYDPKKAPAPHRLPGAGSDRRLFRLFLPAGTVLLVESPCSVTEGPNENDSFVYLAGHLRERGLPVPGIHGYDRERGIYLMEDLDDDDLYGKVKVGTLEREPRDLYGEGVALLAKMQVEGAKGLDTGRLHSPPRYNRELMLRWESGYFVREFLDGFLSYGPLPPALEGEFSALADLAEAAGTDFFLHRDYQSRNLKVFTGSLWVIDFQGGRLGPPQYDLAAFLFDPYVELPAALRDDLLEEYLGHFLPRTDMKGENFLAPFPALAVFRLLQALGAYGFLGARQGKEEFLTFVPAGLRLLGEAHRLLPAGEYPALGEVIARAAKLVEERDAP